MNTYIFLFIVSQCILFIYGQELVITLEQGSVRGYKHPTRGLYEFHGIPYATVPTGNDKFKAPLPAPTWENVFEAVNDTIVCPQVFAPTYGVEYKEDCLVANVFVPENNDTSKSVLVIIHGGSFILGFGNMGLPYNLVERDIVVVTINYRLGAHGFLCLNTEAIPCNAGLKDQLAALRWVKRNIAAFGGNPEDISVSGYSAGAVSAELLMLSRTANDLFNKVILESGSAVCTWGANPNGLETAKSLAQGVTDIHNVTALEEHFLSLSLPALVVLGSLPLFGPCLENNDRGEETIVETLPHIVLQSGNYTKLPLLTGYTDAEGLINYPNRALIMPEMNENFGNVLPFFFEIHNDTSHPEAAELLKSFYFDVDVIDDNSIRNYTDYFTDSWYAYWMIDGAKTHANNSAPVYLYEYRYVPAARQENGLELGADHCEQTYFILEVVGQSQNYTENDLSVQRHLVGMWADFVKYGKPMPIHNSSIWDPLEVEKMNYVAIDGVMESKTFPLAERMLLWEMVVRHNSANLLHSHLGLLLLSLTLLMK